MKILVAETDDALANLIAYALVREGHHVIAVQDGIRARQSWCTEQPDLVLLGTALPGTKAFDLCRDMREQSLTPIIMLGTQPNETDIVSGFECGADDYIVKPFTMRQLVLRTEALLRRTGYTPHRDLDRPRVSIGDLVVDPGAFAVIKNGILINVTRLEFRLLYCLVRKAGTVLGVHELARDAWECDAANLGMLKTHISHIRRKLSVAGGADVFIRAIRHTGYVVTTPDIGAPAAVH